MTQWRVRSYAISDNATEIEKWCAQATDEARAKFDSRLEFLTSRMPNEWIKSYAHQLTGDGDGLFEILFEANNVAHRMLCCFGPKRMEFTILLCAIEHNDRLKPPKAIKIALKRKREVLDDQLKAREFDEY